MATSSYYVTVYLCRYTGITIGICPWVLHLMVKEYGTALRRFVPTPILTQMILRVGFKE